MRFIGSKENLLGFIYEAARVSGVEGGCFCDLFAGTTVVGRYFKQAGYQVISNDLLEYSFVLGKAYIENNETPSFTGLGHTSLASIIERLNSLPPEKGFAYRHYSDEGTRDDEHRRMYFSVENAGRIDAIRRQLAEWREYDRVSDTEFYILLAALLEAVPRVSNIAGTYGAFLKYWEARSRKKLRLETPSLLFSEKTHTVHRRNANELIGEIACDVLYLDPPYNTRQYVCNYHVLETIARWDEPAIYGKTGLRPYDGEQSAFCGRKSALDALRDLVSKAHCKVILLSYNNEGIMPEEAILDILGARGSVRILEQPYRRFRSDSDHEKRRYAGNALVAERIYAVRVS